MPAERADRVWPRSTFALQCVTQLFDSKAFATPLKFIRPVFWTDGN